MIVVATCAQLPLLRRRARRHPAHLREGAAGRRSDGGQLPQSSSPPGSGRCSPSPEGRDGLASDRRSRLRSCRGKASRERHMGHRRDHSLLRLSNRMANFAGCGRTMSSTCWAASQKHDDRTIRGRDRHMTIRRNLLAAACAAIVIAASPASSFYHAASPSPRQTIAGPRNATPAQRVRSRPETVGCGEFPIDRAPVVTVKSGDTIAIDTLSHQGATQDADPGQRPSQRSWREARGDPAGRHQLLELAGGSPTRRPRSAHPDRADLHRRRRARRHARGADRRLHAAHALRPQHYWADKLRPRRELPGHGRPAMRCLPGRRA